MKKTITKRLSIDLSPEEHTLIKVNSAIHGKTIREYILEAIQQKIRMESEAKHLDNLTSDISPILKELWNNKKDDEYDKL